MSTRRSSSKSLRSTFLYADGHAVQVFAKMDPDAGRIEFVEITERFTNAKLQFKGRLYIDGSSDGLLGLLRRHATIITADEPRKLPHAEASHGYAVGTLQVHTRDGALYFHNVPGFLDGQYKYQPDADTALAFDPEASTWDKLRVSKIHRAETEAVA